MNPLKTPRKKAFAALFRRVVQAMNHDFCPGANRYIYWLKQPIGWVVCGALFSMFVGLLIGPQGFVLMWSFLALLLIGGLWPWLSMKGLSCSLRFSESTAIEGEPSKIILEVVNKWPWPIYGMTVEGELLQDVFKDEDSIVVALKRIPALSVAKFTWHYVPVKRGVLPKTAPKIVTGFPFGMYHTAQEIEVKGQTVVHPKCTDLDGIPELDGANFNIEGMMSDRAGNDGDTIGVRNYRQGDSLRNIHWAKTATSGKLIVRERQTCAQQPICVLLDLTPSIHEGAGSQGSYEWAIRIAASVCRQLHLHHSSIELICHGLSREIKSRATNQKGLGGILNYLAGLPEQKDAVEDGDLGKLAALNAFAKTYFIRTDRSSLAIETNELVPVLIKAGGFLTDDPHSDLAEAIGVRVESNSQKIDTTAAIVVSDPENAYDELAQGWSRGVNYGV